jgi:aminodeoxyfutalosine deaminase
LVTDDLALLPKIELHVHLEGSIRAETAIALARRHGQDPEKVLPLVNGGYPRRFKNFAQFVDLYLSVSAQLERPEDLKTAALDFGRSQRAQRVRYTEATFTAATHLRNGMEAKEMWEAVREGLAESGADVRLIVDAPRDYGVAGAELTVEAVEGADAPIVGFGLSGTENAAPARDFVMLREAADRLGLGLAVHAGETGPPNNIWAALDELGADRIGHGTASVKDPSLVHLLATEHTPVEVCLSSNVVLGVVDSLETHPLPRMMGAGINVLLNSDDPPFFSTTLSEDLAHAERLGGLSRQDHGDLQRRAARAAFAPEELKRALVAEVAEWEALK